jgi:hypothetical protein
MKAGVNRFISGLFGAIYFRRRKNENLSINEEVPPNKVSIFIGCYVSGFKKVNQREFYRQS